ncbi:RDD family protein [Chengkuizengella axinellae]|uniref:RDD family protein n=1 Tax=Chengkuizengella axinellae TaxID=3064388 RepID=A0ABT9J0G1_9BACL|nr:RDD family protein [Chengkuizengella sp. 2205SS18-9]MDP5274500.1 RDD family protein [Chengkuizengella sp. 2205SS18-9]
MINRLKQKECHNLINQPAGLGVRIIASILDSIFLLTISFLLLRFIIGDLYQIFDLLYLIVLPIIWYGYTVGKKICGIRIVKINGDNVGVITMLLRHFGAFIVYGLTLGIAAIISAIMVAMREDKRSIHDFIAGTYVTYDEP